jgi:hypothetical protein
MKTEMNHPVLNTLHQIAKALKSDKTHPIHKICLEAQQTQLLIMCN